MDAKQFAAKKKWVCEQIKNIKKYLEANENENAMIQNLCDEIKSVQKRKICNNISLPQEIRKSQIHNQILLLSN